MWHYWVNAGTDNPSLGQILNNEFTYIPSDQLGQNVGAKMYRVKRYAGHVHSKPCVIHMHQALSVLMEDLLSF